MSYGAMREQTPVIIESIQDFYTAILEYYDELFPLDENLIPFIQKIAQDQKIAQGLDAAALPRFLGIGCATGNLENKLLKYGMDITGIDQNKEMVETAKRRMKRGFSTIRFFEMSAIDMNRFLKKGSFTIVACIENVIPYISDETLMRKFFHDARTLLAPGGKFIIQTMNYDGLRTEKPVRLPDRSSVRVTLSRGYIPAEDGLVFLDAMLELGNGRKIMLQRTTKLLPTPVARLKFLAEEAGFTTAETFGDFTGSPWSEDSLSSVLVFG
jgi:SAM-dependent methyltransferase